MTITSPTPVSGSSKNGLWIFLAGPAQGSPDWQSQVEKDLPEDLKEVTLLNPRRARMSDGPEYYREQLRWETEYLSASDVVMFWFPPKITDVPGRDYGQTTRYELGEWITRAGILGKPVIIGVDPEIPGRRYFVERAKESGLTVYDGYRETLDEVIRVSRSRVKSRRRWFTSDTHFGSDRTLELSKRPFCDVSDMDWSMIRGWNSRVAPFDTVYHLGDFGDPRVLKWLNGKIRLIPGNYEQPEVPEELAMQVEVLPKVVEIGLVGGIRAVMSHIPSEVLHYPHHVDFALFGHTHGRQIIRKWKGLDVGVDAHHFRPISEEEVLWWHQAFRYYDEENFL